jgi:hypothetical protein
MLLVSMENRMSRPAKDMIILSSISIGIVGFSKKNKGVNRAMETLKRVSVII